MSFILLGILNSQVSGAAGGAYELIESEILTSSASSVTFSSIPQDYKHLQLRVTGRNSFTGFAGLRNLTVRFNSDSGTNYRGHILQGNGGSVSSNDTGATTAVRMQQMLPDNDFAANIFGAGVMDILDYSNASKNTTTRALGGATGASNLITLTSGVWLNTNAVTSIELSSAVNDLVAGSRFSLYGVRG